MPRCCNGCLELMEECTCTSRKDQLELLKLRQVIDSIVELCNKCIASDRCLEYEYEGYAIQSPDSIFADRIISLLEASGIELPPKKAKKAKKSKRK
jgi:hypothetical protein